MIAHPPSFKTVRSALAQLRQLDSRASDYDGQRHELHVRSRSLAQEIYSGLGAYFSKKKDTRASKSPPRKHAPHGASRPSPTDSDDSPLSVPDFDSLALVSCHIKIEADTLSGWLLAGQLQPDSTLRGVRILFSTSSISPSSIEWASLRAVSDMNVPPIADAFVIQLLARPALKVKWKPLLDSITACEMHENEMRQFWGNMPADFHLYWASALLQDIQLLAPVLPAGSLPRIVGELASAIRRREIVIERNAGGEADGYVLALPGFDISFALLSGGRVRVEAVESRERFLWWDRSKSIYSAAASPAHSALAQP